MLTPAQADAVIRENIPRLPAEDCPLIEAHERVLRAPILADRDLPPYDRVTMDGYALRSSALAEGHRTFRVVAMQAAGMIPLELVRSEEGIEVATGAAIPLGADVVIPYEDCDRDGSSITVSENAAGTPGGNIHRRGSDAAQGSRLVKEGTRLTGREIAVAAACGASTLRVAMLPRIAVVVTGDELLDVESPAPASHQVRRSNDYAVRAALLKRGYRRIDRFHFRDMRKELLEGLTRLIAEFDVVLLTGGVSKGKYDFVPSVLEELRVQKKFQGVAQKPGKPFWFGVSPRHTPVFALPGNPVSTYVCLHRYVLPALAQMSGENPQPPRHLVLAADVAANASLAQMVSVRADENRAEGDWSIPVRQNNSGDYAGLVETDGFVEIPASAEAIKAGTPLVFWPWC